MAQIITSQHFLSDEIVARKIAAEDYAVLLSPEFEIDGEVYQVILDGNHSYAASLLSGKSADFDVATPRQHDAVQLLARGEIDSFLHAMHMGEGDYIDAATRRDVW